MWKYTNFVCVCACVYLCVRILPDKIFKCFSLYGTCVWIRHHVMITKQNIYTQYNAHNNKYIFQIGYQFKYLIVKLLSILSLFVLLSGSGEDLCVKSRWFSFFLFSHTHVSFLTYFIFDSCQNLTFFVFLIRTLH